MRVAFLVMQWMRVFAQVFASEGRVSQIKVGSASERADEPD